MGDEIEKCFYIQLIIALNVNILTQTAKFWIKVHKAMIILKFFTRGPMAQQSRIMGHIARDMGRPAIPYRN